VEFVVDKGALGWTFSKYFCSPWILTLIPSSAPQLLIILSFTLHSFDTMYVCMYVQGRVSPCTATSYVVYCTSPENFKQPPCPLAVTAPLAPPTRERRNHHSGGGIDNYILGREMSVI
jgi:hypothetical protein